MRIGRSALAAWKQKNLQEERDVSFENLGTSKIILYDVAAPVNGNSHIRAHWSTGRYLDRRSALDNGKDSHTDGGKTLRDALRAIQVSKKKR